MPEPLASRLASATVVPRTTSRAWAAAAALASGRPVSLAAFAHPAIAATVLRLLAERPIEAVYVFSGQMAQYLPAHLPAHLLADGPPVIVDWVDVDSAKFAQMAPMARWPMRAVLGREARLLGAFERQVAGRVAANLFVSEAEAALFRQGGGAGTIVAVENGVDVATFDPRTVAPLPLARPTIVFTGQMDYAPNVEAATWFAREVLPLVRRHRPGAAFAIVGRAPTAAVRALAGEHVTVTGEVPDTRPWLAAAAVCVAPLRLARGVQNKVLEAMAMARPVVASAAAAEGIDHGGSVCVATGAEATGAAIGTLLDDPHMAATSGAAARARVERRYGWEARLAPLDAILAAAVDRPLAA